jgi:hypothetical protein
MQCPERRVRALTGHLGRHVLPEVTGATLSELPVVDVDKEGLPAQPFLKECSDKLGGLFKIRTPSGKERIVLTDPELFEIMFFPDETTLSRVGGMRKFNENGFMWKGGGISDPTVLDVIRKVHWLAIAFATTKHTRPIANTVTGP